jgi:hypothetical protein
MMLLVALPLAGALMQTPAPGVAATQIVTGRVLDATSNMPLAGVRVMLVPVRNGPPFVPPTRPGMVVTDQDGRYTFTGVEPGRYVLNAQKAGYVSPVGPAVPRLEVAAGERHVMADLALNVGGVITGRVLDPSGQPVVNAPVIAFRGGAPAAPGNTIRSATLRQSGPSAETNDLGEFRLFSLAPDTYYVQASPQPAIGVGIETSPGRMLAPTFYGDSTDPAAAQPIPVLAGQTFGDVVIHMVVVAAFEVSGVVVDEADQPVTGAEVSLMPAGSGSVVLPPGLPNRVRSDGRGQFKLSAVANGTYNLVAAAPVIISSPPAGGPASSGVSRGSSWGSSVGAWGSTETVNGVTTEFRSNAAYQVTVTVNGENVGDVRVVAPRSPRRPN